MELAAVKMDPDHDQVDPDGIFTLYDRFHDGEPLCELGNEDVEATFDIGFDPIENVQSKWDKYLVSKLDLLRSVLIFEG